MPHSPAYGKAYTALMLRGLHGMGVVRGILDIGAGAGTYAVLLRDSLPDTRWTAVEVWSPYVDRFGLTELYDRVVIGDARTLDLAALAPFDAALCGDVLEHMMPEEAKGLVGRLLDTGRLVVVSIPVVPYPQGVVDGNPFEAHVKDDWSHAEMSAAFPDIVAHLLHDHIGVYLMTREDGLTEAIRRLHAAAVPLIRSQFPGDALVWR